LDELHLLHHNFSYLLLYREKETIQALLSPNISTISVLCTQLFTISESIANNISTCHPNNDENNFETNKFDSWKELCKFLYAFSIFQYTTCLEEKQIIKSILTVLSCQDKMSICTTSSAIVNSLLECKQYALQIIYLAVTNNQNSNKISGNKSFSENTNYNNR
jgi:hypothetical protein